mgnify:CR=1 FL=1
MQTRSLNAAECAVLGLLLVFATMAAYAGYAKYLRDDAHRPCLPNAKAMMHAWYQYVEDYDECLLTDPQHHDWRIPLKPYEPSAGRARGCDAARPRAVEYYAGYAYNGQLVDPKDLTKPLTISALHEGTVLFWCTGDGTVRGASPGANPDAPACYPTWLPRHRGQRVVVTMSAAELVSDDTIRQREHPRLWRPKDRRKRDGQ